MCTRAQKGFGIKYSTDFTVDYIPSLSVSTRTDKAHRFETIIKIVSGFDPQALDIVARVYGSVATAHLSRS